MISNRRGCNDLDLILPNLCVCQGWSRTLKNDSTSVHFLDFAVGRLNEIIQKSQQQRQTETRHHRTGAKMKCKPLVPVHFDFVTERVVIETGKKVTTFDVEVQSGDIDEAGMTERFHMELESVFDDNAKQKSMALALLTFDRVSPYGPYRVCADRRTDIKLCICDRTTPTSAISNGLSTKEDQKEETLLPSSLRSKVSANRYHKEQTTPPSSKITEDQQEQFRSDTPTPLQLKLGVDKNHIRMSKVDKCVTFKQTTYPSSAAAKQRKKTYKNNSKRKRGGDGGYYSITYEVTNTCSTTYDVTLTIKNKLKNIRTSDRLPFKRRIPPHGTYYMGSVVRVKKKRPVLVPLVKVKLKPVLE